MLTDTHRRLERMRAERLEREKKERARANRLISGEPDPQEVNKLIIDLFRVTHQFCNLVGLTLNWLFHSPSKLAFG